MKIKYFLLAIALYSITTHAMEQEKSRLLSNAQMPKISITNNASQAKPMLSDSDYEKWFDAINRGNVATVDSYIKQRIDVNQASKKGQTPLYRAAWGGHKDVVELLLNAHANVNQASNKGKTPLDRAACYGHKEVVELLLKAGAKVNQANKKGQTPLHRAACYNHKGVAELLLKAYANVNQENKKGQTSLYRAAWCGHKNVVELLVAHNAVIDQKTINKTRENRHEQIAQYLELCKNLQRILCR